MSQRAVRQGDIFWIASESLRPAVEGVPHPHVIIQEDILNESRIPTTVVCGLSSNLRRISEPGNVVLEPDEGGLPHRSVVIVSQVSIVEKDVLTQPMGRLSQERLQQILGGMLFLQRAFFDR